MAYSVEVTKQAVTKTDHPDGNRYRITLQMVLSEDGQAVLTHPFSEVYVVGESAATTIKRFDDQMQKTIEDFKAAAAIYKAAALDNAIATLQNGLEV